MGKGDDLVATLAAEGKRLGVLSVDMQEYYLRHIYEPDCIALVDSQVALIEAARASHTPLAAVRYGGFGPLCDEIDYALGARSALVERFVKKQRNAFTNSALHRWFKDKGVDTILITGVNASECVSETYRGAQRSFTALTAMDCLGDKIRCGPWDFDPETILKSYRDAQPLFAVNAHNVRYAA